MPTLLFQVITIIADLVIINFAAYYLLKVHRKEKNLQARETELKIKEGKIDTNYHQVVDDALTKERKILEDATAEADHIIVDAEYINKATKDAVNEALQKMTIDIQKEAFDTARTFMDSYQVSLKQLVLQSLTGFQNTVKGLENDMQQQLKEFHETLLPKMEKELEEYKQSRIGQTDQMVIRVVQKASQELLNKNLSLDDHQKLVIESLEKAKKEGVFDQ